MSAYRLSNRYAKSLLELAIEKNQLEEVNRDVRFAHDLIQSNHQLQLLLKSPIIHPDQKNKIADKLFGGSFSEITKLFFQLIISKRREEYLQEVLKEFINQYNEYKNITPVYLTTAIPVSDEVRDSIVSFALNEDSMKNIEMHTTVDDSIIGGFVLKYKDKMFDASVHRQLEKMDDAFLTNPYVSKVG